MKKLFLLAISVILMACSTDSSDEQRVIGDSQITVPIDVYTLVVETGPFQPWVTARVATRVDYETGHIQFDEVDYNENTLSFIFETWEGPVTKIEANIYIEAGQSDCYIYLYNSNGELIDEEYVDYETEWFYEYSIQ